MTAFILAAIALGLTSVAWLTRPLWRHSATSAAEDAAAARPRVPFALALGLFVFGVAAAGYWSVGSIHHLPLGPESARAAAAAASSAPTAGDAAAMVEQLAERMKTRPDDVEGWTLLARSYVALGRYPDGVAAYKKAAALRPDDAGLLADHAYALAMANGRKLQGEPVQMLERALVIDPQQPKALALAGTAAFDRRDYARAVRYWETLARSQSASGVLAQQLQASIGEARRLGGLASSTAATDAGAVPARISGSVSLAPALHAKVSPQDTVFVFARAVDGPRMPLAIVRKRVSDLPFEFTLDDSMAMSPSARLSGVAQVVVGARISKSGNAMAGAGDLQGFAPAVAVGASGVKVEIAEEVAR